MPQTGRVIENNFFLTYYGNKLDLIVYEKLSLCHIS